MTSAGVHECLPMTSSTTSTTACSPSPTGRTTRCASRASPDLGVSARDGAALERASNGWWRCAPTGDGTPEHARPVADSGRAPRVITPSPGPGDRHQHSDVLPRARTHRPGRRRRRSADLGPAAGQGRRAASCGTLLPLLRAVDRARLGDRGHRLGLPGRLDRRRSNGRGHRAFDRSRRTSTMD